MDVPRAPAHVEESSALERGRKGPLAICVSTWGGESWASAAANSSRRLLGLRIGVAPRRLGLRQGGMEHPLPLVRTFAPRHFCVKAVLQGRDQFAEGRDLVGLFLRTGGGKSATLLSDFSASTPLRRRIVASRGQWLPVTAPAVSRPSGQAQPLDLQGGETPDIGTIGSPDQMGEHVHIGKGEFDDLPGRAQCVRSSNRPPEYPRYAAPPPTGGGQRPCPGPYGSA